MSFDQLLAVSRICHGIGAYYSFVEEWNSKRETLFIYVEDIPKLVEEYKKSEKILMN